jgi:hypothetical protein
MDIPMTDVAIGEIPVPPAGYEIVRVDVWWCVRGARSRHNVDFGLSARAE